MKYIKASDLIERYMKGVSKKQTLKIGAEKQQEYIDNTIKFINDKANQEMGNMTEKQINWLQKILDHSGLKDYDAKDIFLIKDENMI